MVPTAPNTVIVAVSLGRRNSVELQARCQQLRFMGTFPEPPLESGSNPRCPSRYRTPRQAHECAQSASNPAPEPARSATLAAKRQRRWRCRLFPGARLRCTTPGESVTWTLPFRFVEHPPASQWRPYHRHCTHLLHAAARPAPAFPHLRSRKKRPGTGFARPAPHNWNNRDINFLNFFDPLDPRQSRDELRIRTATARRAKTNCRRAIRLWAKRPFCRQFPGRFARP